MSNDPAADMFSLGMVFHAVFNDGKTLFECRDQLNIYTQNVEEVSNNMWFLSLIYPESNYLISSWWCYM